MANSGENMGNLSRSSSASKGVRNMSMNPGVQAKLMAFQAKRKQQMEQSKHVGSHENSEMSDDDTAVIDGGTLNASTFNNSKIINNDNNSNNNNNNNNDVNIYNGNNVREMDNLSLNTVLKNSVVQSQSCMGSPSTPVSVNSVPFDSPVLSANDEREALSRRTSFRVNNSKSNSFNTQQNLNDDGIIRRTSFRLNKQNSTNSSTTVSDDGDRLDYSPVKQHKQQQQTQDDQQQSSLVHQISHGQHSPQQNKQHDLDQNQQQQQQQQQQALPALYPLNKSLSYLSRVHQSHSSSSSVESLGSFQPPQSSLPPLPTSTPPTETSQDSSGATLNTDTPPFLQNAENILKSKSLSSTHTLSAGNVSSTKLKSKIPLSQRRGMKLNLSSLDGSTGSVENKPNPSSEKPKLISTSSSESIDSLDPKPFTVDHLKNKMKNININNRSNMDRLRDNARPAARRNPMNLNLNSLNLNANNKSSNTAMNVNNSSSINNTKPKLSKSLNRETGFTPFAKYIDIKSGSLNFSGKASLHSKGIDFSNGSSFHISMDDLDILEELGHGNYGVVFKVLHKPTGIVMAMKEVRLELDDAKFRQILMELEVLHSCNTDCIVEFYGAFFVEGAVYMCMEFMEGGSLDKIYGSGIPEISLAYITKRVVTGLRVLKEEHNVIHRDVKPTNMLVNKNGVVKLCDFGVSGNLIASLARTNIGCQSYMAPERIKHTNQNAETYSVQSDVWSLGLSILEISKGSYPYPPETYNNVFSQLSAIVDGEVPELEPGSYSEEARDFVRQCLNKNPDKRPTYDQLLSHRWLQMYPDEEGERILSGFVENAQKNHQESRNKSQRVVPALHSGMPV
ncbi:unnamed protein product [Pichia kudriavzevii]